MAQLSALKNRLKEIDRKKVMEERRSKRQENMLNKQQMQEDRRKPLETEKTETVLSLKWVIRIIAVFFLLGFLFMLYDLGVFEQISEVTGIHDLSDLSVEQRQKAMIESLERRMGDIMNSIGEDKY